MHPALPSCGRPPLGRQWTRNHGQHTSVLQQLCPAHRWLVAACELLRPRPNLAAASSSSHIWVLHASQQQQQQPGLLSPWPTQGDLLHHGQPSKARSSSSSSSRLLQRPRMRQRRADAACTSQHSSSSNSNSSNTAGDVAVDAGLSQSSGQHSQQQHAKPAAQAPAGTAGISSTSRSAAPLRAAPVRPSVDVRTAQQQQQQQQQPREDRLLTWRSSRKQPQPAAAPRPQQQAPQQPPPQQQAPPSQQPAVLPLEPSVDDATGSLFLTSPVSVVSATTSTRRLAGSLGDAFRVHRHQLLFAVGPAALATGLKALATAHGLLATTQAAGDSTAAAPPLADTHAAVAAADGLQGGLASQQQQLPDGSAERHILMQPTLRGRSGRTASYALDVSVVGGLPLDPGAASNANIVHITSASNEQQAARSLVQNMPARGQTVLRVAGPAATETAVLAVALARPLMRQRWGQDLAVAVLWNENRAYSGRQTGLLLCVFRCVEGSFPPQVLLMPASARQAKRARYWEQRQQQKQKRQGVAGAASAAAGCDAAGGGVLDGHAPSQQ